jgi:hypothetical protein
MTQQPPPQLRAASVEECPCSECGSKNSVYTDYTYVCAQCGVVSEDDYMWSGMRNMPAQEVFMTTSPVASYPYERLHYFRKRLRQIQGKPLVRIPDDVVQRVKDRFKDISSPISPELIKIFARSESSLRRYARHARIIYNLVHDHAGSPLWIPRDVEKLMEQIFVRFDRHYYQQTHNRKKFLDICYFCRELLQLVDELRPGQHDAHAKYAELFRELRTADSRVHNGTIFNQLFPYVDLDDLAERSPFAPVTLPPL